MIKRNHPVQCNVVQPRSIDRSASRRQQSTNSERWNHRRDGGRPPAYIQRTLASTPHTQYRREQLRAYIPYRIIYTHRGIYTLFGSMWSLLLRCAGFVAFGYKCMNLGHSATEPRRVKYFFYNYQSVVAANLFEIVNF